MAPSSSRSWTTWFTWDGRFSASRTAPCSCSRSSPDGKYANKVKVTFGRSSVNTIEVKDGLKVGDRVILSDMSAYDDYDRIKLN